MKKNAVDSLTIEEKAVYIRDNYMYDMEKLPLLEASVTDVVCEIGGFLPNSHQVIDMFYYFKCDLDYRIIGRKGECEDKSKGVSEDKVAVRKKFQNQIFELERALLFLTKENCRLRDGNE